MEVPCTTEDQEVFSPKRHVEAAPLYRPRQLAQPRIFGAYDADPDNSATLGKRRLKNLRDPCALDDHAGEAIAQALKIALGALGYDVIFREFI